MHVPVLVMMLESQHKVQSPGRKNGAPRVRKATQADIDAFLAS